VGIVGSLRAQHISGLSALADRTGLVRHDGEPSGMKQAWVVAERAYTGPRHPRNADPRVNPPRYLLVNDEAVAVRASGDYFGARDGRGDPLLCGTSDGVSAMIVMCLAAN